MLQRNSNIEGALCMRKSQPHGARAYCSTLEEKLSITTVRCNLAIATHGKKIHLTNKILTINRRFLVVMFGQQVTRTLRFTIKMTYICILISVSCNDQVATDGCDGQVFF